MNFGYKCLICFVFASNFIANVAENKKVAVNCPKKSAIVVDYTNGQTILYNDKADEKRYPASLTKMMTVYILFDALKSKKVSMDTKFYVSKYAVAQAPSKLELKAGSKISVLNAIKALMIKSANDVAVVVAEGLAGNVKNFCRIMNKKSKLIGMTNTHFENPSGLPDAKQTSCARDMAKLGIALYRDFPQYRHFLSLKKFEHEKKTYKTHCKILHWYKGADVAKTGYICASGFNLLVSAGRYDKSGKFRRLFAVVMGGDSAKARDLCAGQLMDKYFDSYNIAPQKTKNKSIQQSLNSQISKSEMIEDIIQTDKEILVSNSTAISNFNNMLDKLYEENDECISTEDEIVVTPKKQKHKKKRYSRN